ncbi:Uncharacterized protein TCM_043303 [Theobroma cacao]|uniref:Uncharacterized protein n=1 Tax=Theobroma cacao TaxID=3641 RepID=A0A061FNC5_THECC|nr:Uncharacterized protein TCM_043303 [Theobroma cacao]
MHVTPDSVGRAVLLEEKYGSSLCSRSSGLLSADVIMIFVSEALTSLQAFPVTWNFNFFPDVTFNLPYRTLISFVNYMGNYSGDVKREFTGIIVHEADHVEQWNGNGQTLGGLIEGIADYIRLKAGYAPPHWVRQIIDLLCIC